MSVLIIAEAGVNHNGCVDTAKKMIFEAARAGADIVKFQTFNSSSLVTKEAALAAYQANNIGESSTQYEMLKKLELSAESHIELIKYCRELKIQFLSTAFDDESLEFLNQLGQQIYKIPSGELTNLPYLRKVASFKKKIILSTGMAFLEEVTAATNVLMTAGVSKSDISILHCTSEYPAPMGGVNLKAMVALKNDMGFEVGYSDHTRGIEIAIAATALGAKIIEKHFTLSRSMPGPDHLASLEPDELHQMVSSIRNIELAIGDGVKKPSLTELDTRNLVRKSIFAKTKIKKGEKFSEANICCKRPGFGISPMKWDDVVGKIAKKSFNADDLIDL